MTIVEREVKSVVWYNNKIIFTGKLVLRRYSYYTSGRDLSLYMIKITVKWEWTQKMKKNITYKQNFFIIKQ